MSTPQEKIDARRRQSSGVTSLDARLSRAIREVSGQPQSVDAAEGRPQIDQQIDEGLRTTQDPVLFVSHRPQPALQQSVPQQQPVSSEWSCRIL